MSESNKLNYIDIDGDITTKKQKLINIKKARKLLDEIKDSVVDYVPNSNL